MNFNEITSMLFIKVSYKIPLLHFVAVTIIKSVSIIYATNKQLSDDSVKTCFDRYDV